MGSAPRAARGRPSSWSRRRARRCALTEQTVLLNAATAYMNLLRDAAILQLQRSNVEVLQEQLRQTRDRFNVGEVTRTDVAQVGIAACGRARARADGGIQLHHLEGDLPAGDRRRARHAGAGQPGRPPVAANACEAAVIEARARHPTVTTAHVQRRCRGVPGQDRGRLALSDPELWSAAPSKNFGSTDVADDPAEFCRPRWPASSRSRSIRAAPNTRPSARPRRRSASAASISTPRATRSQQTVTAVLGPARGRQGPDPGHHAAGHRRRDRAQRRARGSPRRPAHHARRAQRPAGTGQRPRCAGHRPARPGGGVLYAAGGDRRGCRRRCWPSTCRSTTRGCTTIRCATAGSACARRTENSSKLSAPVRRADMCVSTGLRLRSRIAVPYLGRSESISSVRVIRRGRRGFAAARRAG